MRLLLTFGLFLVFVRTSVGQSYTYIHRDASHPGKCVVDGYVLAPGNEAPLKNECGKMVCRMNGLVVYYICDNKQTRPGSRIGRPLRPKSSYPDCCDKKYVSYAKMG